MKYLSVFIALLFFVMGSFASILDFQNDFTKATGLCFKPKISGKSINLDTQRPSTQITTELKVFNYGVISVRGGLIYLNSTNNEIERYAKLTLDVKKLVGTSIYEKFPEIVDKLEFSAGYGKRDKAFIDFTFEL
jgi:hypothetical protein